MLHVSIALRLGSLDLDVTIDAQAGETIAILGPNGAGKTTFLRAVAGLTPIDRGQISVDGTILDDVARGVHVLAERRPIAIVFQDYLLFPHLSALENVAFGLRARGMKTAYARARARDWLERLGIAEQAEARPRALSGGTAQRVALARALAMEPRVLLLDEPLAALDASARGEIRRDLKRHLSSFGGMRVLVTHDPLEAIALADRLVILERGRVVQAGRAADVTERPRSRYVAELVGVNLMRGRASGGEIALDGATLHAAEAEDGDVFAVIHPRAVAIHRQRPEGSPRNVWQGRAASLDHQGDRVRVRVDGPVPIVAEITTASLSALGLDEGADVWVSVKATEVAVYPA